MASRIFNRRQALEKEVKDIYAKIDAIDLVAATATLDLTTDIVLTSAAAGSGRNTDTFTIQVAAAADNPTDTVLVTFSGTADAIVCTVTPNDGTNNTATPVDLTTAELVELINIGSVTGKNVTLTDGSSLRALQTATGGDSTALADSGEGDAVAGTFSGGSEGTPEVVSGEGVSSVSRSSTGVFVLTLDDAYFALKMFEGIILHSTALDLKVQLVSQDVKNKTLTFRTIAGTTLTDPPDAASILLKLDLKNSSV